MKKLYIIGLLLFISACNLPVPTQEVETPPTQPPPATPEVVEPTQAELTPEPLPLYFTDEFDTTSTYWEFLQAGGMIPPVTAFQGGTLRIDMTSPDTWLIGIHNANTYSNVFVRATTSVSPAGSTGLICRYSEDGWYEFNIAHDGTYNLLLGQWLSPGVAKYIPIINDLSNKLTGGAPNEIGLFCEDNFLQLYANGTLIRRVEVTNFGLTNGKIGITASSFSEVPMSGMFEKISVAEQ